MASKIYTAQEMRYAADVREAWGDKDEVNNMLRHAADMIEREAANDAEIASLKKSVERWMQYHETAKGERDACLDELKKKDAKIAELRECLQLAIQMKCTNCGLCTRRAEPCYPDGAVIGPADCWMIIKWREALEGGVK